MAESFAFNIAGKVLGKLGSIVYQEIFLAWGVKSELKQLEDTLLTIKAVLLDAEEKQAKNRQLSVWLGKLKKVCYDANDVIEEFEYEALWRQVVNRGGVKTTVRNFFSSSNPLAFRIKMGHRIKEINEKLVEIAAEKANFHLSESICVVHMERETHSFVQTSDVIGRDDDKQNIITLLMHPSDNDNVSIIPIVGIGGLGKTTLAKLVFNDETVAGHFDFKMWVCVSDDFEVKKLTKKVINSATGTDCGDLTLDQLQSRLRYTLSGMKFLLILDDVWNQDHSKWVELKNLLTVGAKGSKIIVTTRSPLVASIMGTIPAYNLEGLSHKECLSLFVKWAFRDGEDKCHPKLLEIGDELVRKCKGVPLAARTLGSLLYLKTDIHDWLRVKDNEIWKLEQNENDILPAMRLSYDTMPSYLKQCFAFCSIFPKDFEFNNVELIYLWIAQDFFPFSNEDQELEDIGQRCINELWSRSFIQDFEEYNLVGSRFKMHDLVHDLASSVAEGECSTVSCHTSNISERLRHVSFSNDDSSGKESPTLSVQLCKNIQTMLWQAEPTGDSLMETSISRFNHLRVLDLSESCIEVLPNSMGKLKHLRYLDLSGNLRIKKLPNSICNLVNLQTLNLRCCKELEELPRDIGNLIRLRCLWLTTKQMVLAEEGIGIGCLTSLRFLWIGACRNLKSLSEGMQSLTALRTLLIVDCKHLESLPRSVTYLTTLETLAIGGCEKLNLMELEGDFQGLRLSLQSLFIFQLPKLVALPPWLQGASNTLKSMHIRGCFQLIEFPEWLQDLTSLQKLEIDNCPSLLKLPKGMHRLTALRELKIHYCSRLFRRCNRETGVDWPKIAHVPHITLDKVTYEEEEEETFY